MKMRFRLLSGITAAPRAPEMFMSAQVSNGPYSCELAFIKCLVSSKNWVEPVVPET